MMDHIRGLDSKKIIDQIFHGEKAAVFFLSLLFVVNILWFYKLGFHTITGDDLRMWGIYEGSDSFWRFVLVEGSIYKARPVFNLWMYVLFKLFSSEYRLFFYFNILFNFLIILALWRLISKIAQRNNLVAFSTSILYLVSCFSPMQIFQCTGILESFSLLLFVLILYNLLELLERGRPRNAYYSIFLYFLIVFTHERYIVLGVPLLFCLFLLDSLTLKRRIILLVSISIPPLLSYLLVKFYIGTHFLVGTQEGVPIHPHVPTILKFMLSGILSVLGVNLGPEYLMGAHFHYADLAVKATGLTLIGLFLLIFLLFVLDQSRTDIETRRLDRRFLLLCGVLLVSLIFISSITVYQELRWLYAPYIVLLCLTAYMISRITYVPLFKYGIFAALCLLMTYNEVCHKRYWGNLYFMYSYRMADSLFDETIKKYGTRIADYKLFVVKHRDIPWVIQGARFFDPYLDRKTLQVVYVDDIRQIDLKNVDRFLALRLNWSSRRFENITDEVAYSFHSKDNKKGETVFDFIKEFDKGEINSSRKVETPTGKGALIMEWSTSIVKRKTLTILSGFSYSYQGVKIGNNDVIHFSLWMPLQGGDGARAFVEFNGVGGKKRIFAKDLEPRPSLWQDVDLSLKAYANKKITLTFGAESPSGDQTADWIAFGDPVIRR